MEVFMNCVSFFIAHVCEVLENSFIFLYQVYTKIKIPLRISTKALIYQNELSQINQMYYMCSLENNQMWTLNFFQIGFFIY